MSIEHDNVVNAFAARRIGRRDNGCFAVAMLEIGTLNLNKKMPSYEELRAKLPKQNNGGVGIEDVLMAVDMASTEIGVPVRRVIMSRGAYKLAEGEIPPSLFMKIIAEDGNFGVKPPSICIYGAPGEELHAEADRQGGIANHLVAIGVSVKVVVEFEA